MNLSDETEWQRVENYLLISLVIRLIVSSAYLPTDVVSS